ncbi:MAG: DUF692 family protein [Deltaproteobacteria bacterium]|nr:MAG: DUF692 family protein [Deltaproteobacteria bacterium]
MIAGVGLGLRPQHYGEVLSTLPAVPFFEVISENYMGLREGGGGRPLEILERVRAHYPILLHGVSMNLGSADPIDRDYLRRLGALADRVQPLWMSDHLCWTGVAAENLHDLLPLPFTSESLRHLASRIAQVQDALGRPLLVENVSSYLTYAHSTMREWEFLAELVRRTGCGLLLDVNNVYVSAVNQGFDPAEFLRGLPRKAVQQIHLAGYSTHGPVLIDTHDHPVSAPVLQLYAEAVRRFGAVPTMIEWDEQIPPFAELLHEARVAADVQRSALQRTPSFQAQPRRATAAIEVGGPPLARLQRWMRWMLTDPRGVRGALDNGSGPRRAQEPKPRLFGRVVGGEDRLGIYANAYFLRIRDSLASDFRAVRRAVGEHAFHRLVAEYLVEQSSHEPTLAALGEQLPGFLSRHGLSRMLPFLPELAQLEWSALQALLGPPRETAGIGATGEWADARADLDSSVALLRTRWPVDRLWADRDLPERRGSRVLRARRRSFLIVRRAPEGVRVDRLPPAAFATLSALRDGVTLGEACERIRYPARVSAWFAQWVRDGVIQKIRFTGVTPRWSKTTQEKRPAFSGHGRSR